MDAATKARVRAALAHGWFGRQPDELQERILEHAFLRRFAPGQTLYRVGDPPAGIFALVSGAWTVAMPEGAGGEAVFFLGQQGLWIGELAVLEPSPYVVSLHAYRPSETLFLPARGFERIVADDPQAYRQFVGIMADHVRTLLRLTAELLLLPTTARVAARLGLMCDGLPTSGGPPTVEITQGDLAVMLGVSRQRLNTCLGDLARAGALELGSRRIVVRDRARLAAFACRPDDPAPVWNGDRPMPKLP